jgi:hypothetical protein
MASILKVDDLRGNTAADDITVTDGSVSMKLQTGLIKGFTNFDGSLSTLSSRVGFNESSLTDNGSGDFSMNYTNNMDSADYSCACTGSLADGTNDSNIGVIGPHRRLTAPLTTSSIRVHCTYNTAGHTTFNNLKMVFINIIGDLA